QYRPPIGVVIAAVLVAIVGRYRGGRPPTAGARVTGRRFQVLPPISRPRNARARAPGHVPHAPRLDVAGARPARSPLGPPYSFEGWLPSAAPGIVWRRRGRGHPHLQPMRE